MAVDLVTEALVLQLQINDVDELMQETQGRPKLEESEIAALKILQEELVAALLLNCDHRLVIHLFKTDEADRAIITELIEQEAQALEDFELAMRLSNLQVRPESCANARTMIRDTAKALATMKSGQIREEDVGYDSALDSVQLTQAEGKPKPIPSSSFHKGQGKAQQILRVQCDACLSDHAEFDTWRLRCSHSYCRDCLVRLFQEALNDTDRFPPRCCKSEIPFEDVEGYYFTKEFADTFKEKRLELTTKNPLYCSEPTCSKFLRLQLIEKRRAVCPSCETMTCASCRQAGHEGTCEDQQNKAVLAMAEEFRWQRCYKCNTLVELTVGCNHMSYVPALWSHSRNLY